MSRSRISSIISSKRVEALFISYYKAIRPEALARVGGRLAILNRIYKVGRDRILVVGGGR